MSNTRKAPITADLLEELSAAELNQRLISLSAFTCKKCSKILTPPIMLVKDLGNVCGTCTSDDNCSIPVHNSALEEILENLIIPCCNKHNGCKEELNYWHISEHESICSYRYFNCPLSLCNTCIWVGSLPSLKNHFSEEHGNDLLLEDDKYFKFDVDISKDKEIVKLLCNKNYNFILRIKCDLEELKLRCIVYYITKKEEVPDFLYSIELEDCGIAGNIDNIVSQDINLPTVFETYKSVNIDLSFMKHIVDKNQTVVSTIVKIVKDGYQESHDENLLKVFECPVCSYYMRPPIPLCLNGHSVCNSCQPKLKDCPICRTPFGTGRNYGLEQLCNDMRFPCIYRDQGCYMVLKGSDMVKHELQCNLQTYSCPSVASCSWKGVNCLEVLDHLSLHKKEVIHGNYHLREVILTDKTDIYYMLAHDCIFRVSNVISLRKQCVCWLVELVVPRNACAFKYEIGFMDKTNMDRRFIQIRTCLKEDHWIAENSVKIMLSTLRLFSKHDRYITYCKISKVVDTHKKRLVSEEMTTILDSEPSAINNRTNDQTS